MRIMSNKQRSNVFKPPELPSFLGFISILNIHNWQDFSLARQDYRLKKVSRPIENQVAMATGRVDFYTPDFSVTEESNIYVDFESTNRLHIVCREKV